MRKVFNVNTKLETKQRRINHETKSDYKQAPIVKLKYGKH